jgi:hypothetical protein
MHKQALVKKGMVRTHVDLSALYPKDPIRQPQEHANARQSDTDCADGDHCEKKESTDCSDGDHCEHGAMREALEGWRWI